MKKILSLLTILVSFPVLAISFTGFAAEARADGLYNAREELEYGHHAMMARQEERVRQMQFQQYQQQQYMHQQQLMNQQSMYNQTHRSGGRLNPKTNWGDGNK